MKTTITRGFAPLFIALFIAAAPAQAQNVTADAMPAVWQRNIAKQMKTLMQSDDAATRAEALHLTAELAYYGQGEVNLRPTISPLLKVYQNDEVESNRLLAVSALYAIGDKEAMEKLAVLVQEEENAHVRRIAEAAVVAFYAELSPFETDDLDFSVTERAD